MVVTCRGDVITDPEISKKAVSAANELKEMLEKANEEIQNTQDKYRAESEKTQKAGSSMDEDDE